MTRYRAKGAIRDVGKALGLPEDLIKALSSGMWSWSQEVSARNVKELNLNPDDRRLVLTLQLAQQLMGAPRHLGQHPGGFVLTRDRLDDLVPIEPASMKDRQIIEWDKDDVEALKMMKVDVLALGMLTCMSKAFDLIRKHKDEDLDLSTIRQEDPATYAMIRKADTLGTFQIESRAQMAMLPRLKPRTFYDLVVQVAIVRPGPIQGDMVHPYLRRREGKEKSSIPPRNWKPCSAKRWACHCFKNRRCGSRWSVPGLPAGGRPIAQEHGDLQVHRGRVEVQGQTGLGHGAKRLHRRVRRKDLQPARGVRSYGFPNRMRLPSR